MHDAARTLEAVWRIESARIIAGVARIVRDVGLAEDLAQDAYVEALERWPSAMPPNPAAWLHTVARSRAIDAIRRSDRLQQKYTLLAAEAIATGGGDPAAADLHDIDDDVLRLLFVAAHPMLGAEARAALMLRLIGGLTTDEIARAFLVPVATIAQRIVRAKRTLTAARVPFDLPHRAEWTQRVGSVLDALYLIFNEGYSATAGDSWVRPALCEDVVRLGRLLAQLLPHDGEVLGLLALMELQSSRVGARTGAGGEPILLADQDRARWDRGAIRRGLAALARAERCSVPLGRFALQAAIAAEHARPATYDATDWTAVVALYDALFGVLPTPVVALNRAVAVAMAHGAAAALPLIDELAAEPALGAYYLLPSVRGDLLAKLGRRSEAADAFALAASLAGNAREQQLLRERERMLRG